MFICILKGFGSFLLVTDKSGQKWFGGSVLDSESSECDGMVASTCLVFVNISIVDFKSSQHIQFGFEQTVRKQATSVGPGRQLILSVC